MDKSKAKILVLGGTGAMGTYLVPKLVDDGCTVDVVSADDVKSDNPRLNYIQANAMDDGYISGLLSGNYDGIVDFMIYPTEKFRSRYKLLLSHTGHYIYLSSYRVFARGNGVIDERSPQLLDVSDNAEYLASDDYSLLKARGEDILQSSDFKNYTIIRPAITYSKRRCQLITLERNAFVPKALRGETVYLPDCALDVQATMSWAGDVAEMIRRLLLNDAALCDDYNVCTSEHMPWRDVAAIYSRLFNLKYEPISEDDYLRMVCGDVPPSHMNGARWQLEYDRMFDRVMDNSKILARTGLRQSDLTRLADGLSREAATLAAD